MYVHTSRNQQVVEFSAQTGFAAEEHIILQNTGTVCTDWYLSPAQEISENTFLLGKIHGKLMPKSETEIGVFFLPTRQGVFTQKWKLKTVPPSAAGSEGLFLTFVGVASHEDTEIEKKKLLLKKTMKHKQVSVQTAELVDDIMTAVRTPPSTPPGEFDDFWLKYNNRTITDTVPDVLNAFRAFNDKVNDWRTKVDTRFQPQSPYTIDALASAIISVRATEPQVESERTALLTELKLLTARLNKKRHPDTEIIFQEFLAPVIASFSKVRTAVLQARFGPNVPGDARKEVFEKFLAESVKKQKNVKLPDLLEQCRSEISDTVAKQILDAVMKAVEVSSQARNILATHDRIDLSTSISRIRNRQAFPGDEPLTNQVVLYELPLGDPDSSTLAEILDKTPNALILLPHPCMVCQDSLPQDTARLFIKTIEKLLEDESVCELSDPALFDRTESTGEIGKRVFLATGKILSFPLIASVAIVETFTRSELNSVRSVLVGPEVNAEISKLASALEVNFEAPDSVAPRRNSFATAMSGNLLIFDGFKSQARSLNTLRNLVPLVTSVVYLGGPLGLGVIRTVVNPKSDIATATVLMDLLSDFADIYIPINYRVGDELITLEIALNAEKVTNQIFPGVWVVLDSMAGKLEIINGDSHATQVVGGRLGEVTSIAGSQEAARVKALMSSARKVVWLGNQSDDLFDAELADALSKRTKTSDDELPQDDEMPENDEFIDPQTSQPNRNIFENFGTVPLEACAVVGARKRVAMETACQDGFGLIYVSKNHDIIEASIAGELIAPLDDVWN